MASMMRSEMSLNHKTSYLANLDSDGCRHKKGTDLFFPNQEAEKAYGFGIRKRLIISEPEMAKRITIGCNT
jgi:hypothetical protein